MTTLEDENIRLKAENVKLQHQYTCLAESSKMVELRLAVLLERQDQFYSLIDSLCTMLKSLVGTTQ